MKGSKSLRTITLKILAQWSPVGGETFHFLTRIAPGNSESQNTLSSRIWLRLCFLNSNRSFHWRILRLIQTKICVNRWKKGALGEEVWQSDSIQLGFEPPIYHPIESDAGANTHTCEARGGQGHPCSEFQKKPLGFSVTMPDTPSRWHLPQTTVGKRTSDHN